MSNIISMLIASANATLTANLQNQIALTDETRAGTVRAGLLQDDPTKHGGVNILTFPNDPDSEGTWRHSIASKDGLPGLEIPTWQVGDNSAMWLRRFTTHVEIYLPSTVKDRLRAQELAHTVLLRAEQAIANTPLESLHQPFVDDFGEIAYEIYTIDSYASEAGGTGSYIWHGVIRWMCLTQKTRG